MYWDRHPLHLAVEGAAPAARIAARLRKLVEEGADLESRDLFGKTALLRAAELGNSEAVACLRQLGANVAATTTREGWGALHLAAGNGHTGVVSALLADGIDPDTRDACGETPLHWAARWGRQGVLQQLLAAKATLEATDADGRTPTHVAAEYGRSSVLQQLRDAGASHDVRDARGRSPRDLAQLGARRDAVALLNQFELADTSSREAPPTASYPRVCAY
eukprot:jgi/Tetstr1/433391/TSEL_022676.t1